MDAFDEEAGREDGKRDALPPLRALDRAIAHAGLSPALEKRSEEELALLEERVTPLVQDFMRLHEAQFHERDKLTDWEDGVRLDAWASIAVCLTPLSVLLEDRDMAYLLLERIRKYQRYTKVGLREDRVALGR